MDKGLRRPRPVAFLVAAMLFQAASALYGGAALVAAPSGRLLGMPRGLLQGTPFDDYFIPGVILFWLLGAFPLLVAYGLWRRPAWGALEKVNPWRRYEWPWSGAVLVGTALLAWIAVQVALVGYVSRLQPFYGLVGAGIIRLAITPSIKQWYSRW